MTALAWLIPAALALGLLGLAAFLWALRSGQFEDLEGASWRAIQDSVASRTISARLSPPRSRSPASLAKAGSADRWLACLDLELEVVLLLRKVELAPVVAGRAFPDSTDLCVLAELKFLHVVGRGQGALLLHLELLRARILFPRLGRPRTRRRYSPRRDESENRFARCHASRSRVMRDFLFLLSIAASWQSRRGPALIGITTPIAS